MNPKTTTASLVLLVAALAGGYFVWRSSQDSDGGDAGGLGAKERALVGRYALDQEGFRESILKSARDWARSNGDGLPEGKQKKMLDDAVAEAEQAAAGTRIELELRADETFTLRLVNPKEESIGVGSWVFEGDQVTLDTETVEGVADDGPSPPLHLRVQGRDLVMNATPGIPFDHTLVRQGS